MYPTVLFMLSTRVLSVKIVSTGKVNKFSFPPYKPPFLNRQGKPGDFPCFSATEAGVLDEPYSAKPAQRS